MLKLRKLAAVFYKTSNGREPVRDWLLELQPEDRKVIGRDIQVVQYEWPLGRPLVDHLRGGIWEVRSGLSNRQARVLFAVPGEEIVLLHGFIKKTRSTPREDLALAERRWRHWQGQRQEDSDE